MCKWLNFTFLLISNHVEATCNKTEASLSCMALFGLCNMSESCLQVDYRLTARTAQGLYSFVWGQGVNVESTSPTITSLSPLTDTVVTFFPLRTKARKNETFITSAAKIQQEFLLFTQQSHARLSQSLVCIQRDMIRIALITFYCCSAIGAEKIALAHLITEIGNKNEPTSD